MLWPPAYAAAQPTAAPPCSCSTQLRPAGACAVEKAARAGRSPAARMARPAAAPGGRRTGGQPWSSMTRPRAGEATHAAWREASEWLACRATYGHLIVRDAPWSCLLTWAAEAAPPRPPQQACRRLCCTSLRRARARAAAPAGRCTGHDVWWRLDVRASVMSPRLGVRWCAENTRAAWTTVLASRHVRSRLSSLCVAPTIDSCGHAQACVFMVTRPPPMRRPSTRYDLD